jgi:N-methylhydantoinase B
VMKPVFYDGELFGFVANIAHMSEIGGMAVGGFAATATEVHQEGLRLPPVWLMREGKYVDDIWKLILANHRAPRYSWGDLHAMVASLHVGERRMLALLKTYGPGFIDLASEELMDHAERWMRSEISAIPDGEYYFEDLMEDDGATTNPSWIRLTLVIDGDELLADFTGTDPQARGVVNCTYGVTAGAVYNAVFHVTDLNVPRNDGAYRPIKIIAPPGTVVNVSYPGTSVAGNTETHPRLWEVVMGALSQAVPDRVSAATGGTACNFLFGGLHPETDRFYVHYHFDGVGWGGRSYGDGNSVQNVPNGNNRTTPIEVFETRYPFIHREYKLRTDSGGAGKQRGGLGCIRTLEVNAPEITVNALFDRMRVAPWGLFGGKSGAKSQVLVKRTGETEFRTFKEVFGTASPSKFTNIRVTKGDQIRLVMPGGGGYGDPIGRDPSLVLRDVVEGFVSLQAAREVYGVVIEEVDGEFSVDETATVKLRRCREQQDTDVA